MTLIPTLALALILTTASLSSLAGPGAHGPNGEHLDAPAQAGNTKPSSPRLETHTELFELVATLAGAQLSVWIDRFETNEPVLNAGVEVESGGLKAKARFVAELGSYTVDDAALLKRLAQPGSHALVFTVLSVQASDLLDGSLTVVPPSAAHAHGWSAQTQWLAGGGALMLAALATLALRRHAGAARKGAPA